MRSRYDPALAGRLVDLGRRGYLIKSAAEALGISHPTFRRYEREHAEFAKQQKAFVEIRKSTSARAPQNGSRSRNGSYYGLWQKYVKGVKTISKRLFRCGMEAAKKLP